MKKNAQHAGITVTMKNPDGFAALSKRIRRRRQIYTAGVLTGGIVFLLGALFTYEKMKANEE